MNWVEIHVLTFVLITHFKYTLCTAYGWAHMRRLAAHKVSSFQWFPAPIGAFQVTFLTVQEVTMLVNDLRALENRETFKTGIHSLMLEWKHFPLA